MKYIKNIDIDFNDFEDIYILNDTELFIKFLTDDNDNDQDYIKNGKNIVNYNINEMEIMVLVYKDDYDKFLELIKGLDISDRLYSTVKEYKEFFRYSNNKILLFLSYKDGILTVLYSFRIGLYASRNNFGNFKYYYDFRDKKFKVIDELKKEVED